MPQVVSVWLRAIVWKFLAFNSESQAFIVSSALELVCTFFPEPYRQFELNLHDVTTSYKL